MITARAVVGNAVPNSITLNADLAVASSVDRQVDHMGTQTSN